MMIYDVLLIDDELIWKELFMNVVEKHLKLPVGDEVRLTWTDTAAEARELIQRGGWEIILCDLLLANDSRPNEAGIELIRCASGARLDSEGDQSSTIGAVYALTQYSKDQRMSDAAVNAGADEVIGKNTPHERIAQRIREALERSHRSDTAS